MKVKERPISKITDHKKQEPSGLIKPLVRKSKITRVKLLREASDDIPDHIAKVAYFLEDEEAISVRRLATYKHLDFPHVLRARSKNGAMPVDSLIGESAVGDFLTGLGEDQMFVFIEPWLMHGALLIRADLLMSSIWMLLKCYNGSLKLYDLNLSKSCILNFDEDGRELSFAIAG